jgi:fumarate hydratase class I
MSTIKEEDVIQSVADALQYMSYYHPPDYIRALARAYELEPEGAARDAIAQILINSRMCAEGHRPICQDTGIIVAFVKVGQNVHWQGTRAVAEMINEGVRRAYTQGDNPLRASVVRDPAFTRVNTRDNTPAVTHIELVPGDQLEISLAAKGGGSENKAAFTTLNPGASIVDWILQAVPKMGAGWCPPGMLGIGIGGTAEKAMLLAKESLVQPIDMTELKARGPQTPMEKLRVEIYDKVNALGIGAQGLGGLSTVLDVKILDYPCHAASKPIAIIPNCAATRHIHVHLDGNGPAKLPQPDLNTWPKISWATGAAKRVDLDTLTREEVASWRTGERLLLSGRMLTARDAAHKRLADMLKNGTPLPDGLDLRNRVIYYVGPVDPTGNEVVGPAGPTTATRMDSFMPMVLEQFGVLATVGKAERGAEAIKSIAKNRSAYMIAVGGAAYLISKAIVGSRLVAFPDLGMEAIHEFTIKDMPVTVAVDSNGKSVHQVFALKAMA